jgi:hypothetical protein
MNEIKNMAKEHLEMEKIDGEIEHNPDLIDSPIEYEVVEKVAPAAVAPKKRGRPAKVDKEIFIQMWNKGRNLNDVAAALGMPTSSVSVKASLMRKNGVRLKKFTRGRKAKAKA